MIKLFLLFIVFFTGCATSSNNLIELERINFDKVNPDDLGNDGEHRLRAKDLGISYVDYLHLLNNGKLKVSKSYFKLRHDNNE
jgi:hypothetical protein